MPFCTLNPVTQMPPKYGFTAQVFIEEGRVPEEAFNKLKEWCPTQKIPSLSDEQLVLFLLSCHNVLETTQNTIYAYFRCKSGAPELFFNRDMSSDDLQKQAKVCFVVINVMVNSQISVVPVRTPRNEAIIIWKLQDTSFQRFSLEPMVKLAIMVGELLYQDPPDGVIVILDIKGLGLLHVTKFRVGPLRKFFHFLQEGYGCNIKQIHVLNTVYFIDKIMMIMRPLMNKELYSLIKFHPTSLNMNDFFEKFVPKNCFPEDYGGTLPDQGVLSLQTYKVLRAMRKFYEDDEKQIKKFKVAHQ